MLKKNRILVAFLFGVFVFSACEKNQAPDKPQLVSPTNAQANVDYNKVTLQWNCSDADNDILTYDVYIGTTQSPSVSQTALSSNSAEITNLLENTTYYWKVVAKDAEKQSESDVWSFTTSELKCVDYDGNEYEFVTIGEQVWMAENLKSLHYSDGTAIPNVLAYNNQEDLVPYYGRLYRWVDVMNDEESSNLNPSGVQGACPDGWHVPSNAEWQELIAYLGGSAVAGGKMKATGNQFWAEPNTGATNESGFNGLPAGVYDNSIGFTNIYTDVLYWSSTSVNTANSYFTALRYDVATIYNHPSGMGNTNMWLSVRCIKN